MEPPPASRSFWCFISYRHADNRDLGRQWASWLHQQIETYEIPTELVGTRNGRGDEIPERIFPVFRDEDELPADADLSSPIYRALDASKFLVVLCSPRAVQSTYVASEIAYYKKIGRSDRVLAAILAGEPNASWDLGKQASGVPAAEECFPKPLQHPVDAQGGLIETERAEPIAADFRLPDGGEGWTSPEAYRQSLEAGKKLGRKEIDHRVAEYRKTSELAKLKIIAGILGVSLGTLTQRDKAYQLEKARRRASLFRKIAAAMGVLTLLAAIAGVFAWLQKREAETQRQAAFEARDAEKQQKTVAEARRVEAEDARQLADQRRTEAENARQLAEERRLESERRLARSNTQLAERLAKEGDTDGAAAALWEIPESERQWEWGYLLGRAYREAARFVAAPAGPAGTPHGGRLDAGGQRAMVWPSATHDDDTYLPTPGTLRFSRMDETGALQSTDLPVAGRLGALAWSRDGHGLLVDNETAKLLRPDGTVEATLEVEGVVYSGGFIDPGGRRFVLKTGEYPGEQWKLFAYEDGALREVETFTEAVEGERFGAAAADGSRWVAVSSDTGLAIYDAAGKLLEKVPDVWAPEAAFSERGDLAIATVDQGVEVRVAGRHAKPFRLAETKPTIRRNTNGATVCWAGETLYVRTISGLRSWRVDAKEPEQTEGEATFDDDNLLVTVAANSHWVAAGLLQGGIALIDPETMTEVDRLNGHSGSITDLRFVRDDLLASVAEDGTLRYWSLKPTSRYGPDREWLAEGAEPWAKIEEADDSGPLPAAAPGRPYGTRLALASPDGQRTATTGEDGVVRLWDGATLLLTLKGEGAHGEALAFAKDGARLGAVFFTPGHDASYEQIWDARPWTREASGLGPEEDWRKAYEAKRQKDFTELWGRR